MSRRSGRSFGVVVATWACAAIALWATRPQVAGPPATWPADDAARAACWALAAGWTAWCAIALLAIAVTCARPGARRALRWAPRIVRHALPATLAGSLAVAPPPSPVTVHVGTDGRLSPGPTTTQPATTPPKTTTTPAVHAAPPATTRRTPRPARRVRPRQHRVQAGDNLWTIARAELARREGHEPTDRDIAPYWLRVVDANRATLRSGDPNLIYPGEIVSLPNP